LRIGRKDVILISCRDPKNKKLIGAFTISEFAVSTSGRINIYSEKEFLSPASIVLSVEADASVDRIQRSLF